MARRPWFIAALCSLPSCFYASLAWADGMSGLPMAAMGRAIIPLLILAAAVIPLLGIATLLFLWRSGQFVLGRVEAPKGLLNRPGLYKLFGALALLSSAIELLAGASLLIELVKKLCYWRELGLELAPHMYTDDLTLGLILIIASCPALFMTWAVMARKARLRRG